MLLSGLRRGGLEGRRAARFPGQRCAAGAPGVHEGSRCPGGRALRAPGHRLAAQAKARALSLL